jgi:nicotinate phosphoribosyltransferase
MYIHFPFTFSNFGTRRRFSKKVGSMVDRYLSESFKGEGRYIFSGTSNVYNAMVNDIKPIGTMAHEFLQAAQAFSRIEDSQSYALQAWADEYRGDLGIALTDCLGVEFFLKKFDSYFAKLFDGLRHDSGNPFWWTQKVLDKYNELNINPRTKTLVYSDGLDEKKALELWFVYGKEKVKTAFGIGTYLTNDVGFEPLKIVIKMVECNGQPVAKVSDSSGKEMCEDENYVNFVKQTIKKERTKND